jgi:hypothetical protein
MTIELTEATLRALRALGFTPYANGHRTLCKRAVVEIIAPAHNVETCWLGIHCPSGGVIALEVSARKVLIAAGIKVAEAAAE